MHNRLQELTEKLYNEGLEKGRQEAEVLLAQTKEQVKKKLHEAEVKASSILAEANRKAVEIERIAKEDLKQAAKNTLATVQQQVESVLLQKTVDASALTIGLDPEFIEKALLAAIQAWNPKSAAPVELSVLLPAALQNQLEERFKSAVHKALLQGADITFSPKISCGFKIGPKDGSYYVSFSSNDFSNLFKTFLRPKMQTYLFE